MHLYTAAIMIVSRLSIKFPDFFVTWKPVMSFGSLVNIVMTTQFYCYNETTVSCNILKCCDLLILLLRALVAQPNCKLQVLKVVCFNHRLSVNE